MANIKKVTLRITDKQISMEKLIKRYNEAKTRHPNADIYVQVFKSRK